MSGKLADGVNNVNGQQFLGVQLRDFDQVVHAYLQPEDSAIAICSVLRNPLAFVNNKQIRDHFTQFFLRLNGTNYQLNCCTLLCSLYRCCRPCRCCCEALCCRSYDWLFCSELVAKAYKEFRILPSSVNEEDVVPADLVFPEEDNDAMPQHILSEPIYILDA